MKKITLIITAILLSSCQFFSKKEDKQTQNTSVTDTIPSHKKDSTFVAQEKFNEEKLPIEIIPISEKEFLQAKKKAFVPKEIQKITDFNQVQKLLKNVVSFEQVGEEGYYSYGIRKIRFKNGLTYEVSEQPEEYFIAYYPSEDILVCEGGHSSDASFDLKTGRLNDKIGNPTYIKQSPNAKYRINGHYDGQECISYFIEKNNGTWTKIIDLNEIYLKIIKNYLCRIVECFWIDDQTFYFHKFYEDDSGITHNYYKVTIKPTTQLPELDFFDTTTPLPFEAKIDFDNNDIHIPNKKYTNKLLMGLFPYAKNAKLAYRLPISKNYTSLIVSFEKGEELFSYLFNISPKGEIIDYLEVSYDEIAESASRGYSTITKEKVRYTYENDFDGGQKYIREYAISPEGYFIQKY